MFERYLFRTEELPIFAGYGQLNKFRSTKLVFVGYGQINTTTVLDFLHQACMTLAS